MIKINRLLATCLLLLVSTVALGQPPMHAASHQQLLLASPDPALAANKRLVYDFWREVFEGGHLDLAGKYLDDSYIQHNPNVPGGRAGFVEFFSKFSEPKPIAASISAPLISIVAERDMVILVFAKDVADPGDAEGSYATTWFDAFRIADGKIVEHWDPALRQ